MSNTPSPVWSSLENARELILSHLLFLVLAFLACNLLDIFMKKVFDYIESALLFPIFFKKDSNLWLLVKITIQLILVSFIVHQVKKYSNYILLSLDSDAEIYGSNTINIIFAFVAFYSQDNLKTYLNKFNKKLDKRFA